MRCGKYVYGDLLLVNNPISFDSDQDIADIYIAANEIDALTPNTDIQARLSRDGGTTWCDPLPLSEVSRDAANTVFLSGKTNLAALPAGTNLVWEVSLHNAKQAAVQAVGVVAHG